MITMTRSLIQHLRKLGTKYSVKRLQRKANRLQQKVKVLEQERYQTLQQWSRVDKRLQHLQQETQELPPQFQTLENFLEYRKQHRVQKPLNKMEELEALEQTLAALEEVAQAPSVLPKSLPSSMLRSPALTNEQNSSSDRKP